MCFVKQVGGGGGHTKIEEYNIIIGMGKFKEFAERTGNGILEEI